MSQIKTAVIPVAGFGTRQLPITKAIEKCMLPIGNRPVVDYVVEDCALAGIEHIIFVVGEGSNQIRDYYSSNPRLENYLEAKGKFAELEIVKNTNRGIKMSYVPQPSDGAYGTAVPVHLAALLLKGEENFVVRMGDAFPHRFDGQSELALAIEEFHSGGSDHLMSAIEIPPEQATQYGVMKIDSGYNLTEFIEKPSLDKVPRPSLSNINTYIFNRSILDLVSDYMADKFERSSDREYYLTDVLVQAIKKGQRIKVRPIDAEYMDAGTVASWVEANVSIFEKNKHADSGS